MSPMGQITPSRRLAFTVRRCQLPGIPCYLVAHRPSAASSCLYINGASPTAARAAHQLHSGSDHSTQHTHTRYIIFSTSSHFKTVKMAPYYGHGARCTAHCTAHGGKAQHVSSVNSTQPCPQGHRTSTRQDGDCARESQRRHDRQERKDKIRLLRSPNPTVPLRRPSRLADRMTYGNGDDVQGPVDYGDGDELAPRPQQGRSLLQRITRDNGFSGNDGPVSQCGDHRGQAVNSDTDNGRDDASIDVDDDFYDLFVTEPPSRASTPLPLHQPINTKPVQYGSSHDLPFNLHLHPPRPVQPATRREPIRMVNCWIPHEPNIDGLAVDSAAQAPVARGSVAKKRPVNTYRGNDPIKRAFTNAKLRAILSDKGLPKPRKKADRMVLKCAGRKEFR